jgi:hypothetical protein
LVRLVTHCLTIRHNGVALLERDTGVVLLKILETDLEMELSGAANDVLP